MAPVPPFYAVDATTKQFPDAVRQKQAANLMDQNTPEGAAVGAVTIPPTDAGRDTLAKVTDQKLAGWRAGLAAREYRGVNVLCIGDSYTEGQGATATNRRWVDRLRDRLRARFPVAGVIGGEGYVPSVFIAPDRPNRFTLAGGATPLGFYGLGRRSVNLGASGAKATVTFIGTSFSLLYTGGPATNNIQATIDGGAAQVINTNTPAGITSGLRWDSGPLSAGSHTVEFAWNSGGGAVINGIMVFNGDENAGIRVWESGHAGDYASLLVQPGNAGKWIGDVATVKPDVIVLELGINDWRTTGGYDAATFKANMTTLIAALRAQVPSAPIVLFIPPTASGGNPHGAWSAYRDAYYALAAADATLVLCDVGTRTGPTTGNTFPLFNTDNLHPNDQGYSMIADIVLDLLG